MNAVTVVIARTCFGRPKYQHLDKPHISMLRGRWVCGNKERCVTGRTTPIFAYRAWDRDMKALNRLRGTRKGDRIQRGY